MIDLLHRGHIAICRIAHGKANAFDIELCGGIMAALETCRDSSDAAVVITGQGRMFSAGVDLVRLVDDGPDYVKTFLPALTAAFEAVFAFPKPVVAAVNGHAIAGGCILACAADHRLMARGSGRIGIPELRVGVPFPTVPLEIMRFAAPQQLQALVYGRATFTPEEAVERGIVDAVVEPDALIDAAVAAAEGFAALPAGVFELTKRQLREPALQRIRDGAKFEEEIVRLWTAPRTLTFIRDYIARTFKKAEK